MRKIRSRAFVIILALMMVIAGSAAVLAESSTYEGTAVFDGKKIVSSFDSGEIAGAVSDLQPGDEATFTITYENEYDGDTDWYMSNEVIQTLEKSTDAKKVTGVGSAENGGYTYELYHTDKNGEETVLFSNSTVGGEAKPGDMQGLEQATNALDDWFYIQTLAKDESGEVKLHVAFEGETEVNDYMDTSGGVELRFAVEIPSDSASSDVSGTSSKRVETGDDSRMLLWSAVLVVAALLMFVLTVISRRRDPETEDGPDNRTGGDA